ncbi:MAG: hypothetical protein ACOYXB_11720 [Bacteroidota bacterium]
MKAIRYIIISCAVLVSLTGCQKDPLAEVNAGEWNKERNILGITFDGQVGSSVITRDGDIANINFTYNTSASADFSAIRIATLELSYGATASVTTGDELSFENDDNSATITVTPVHGDPLIWTITLTPFTEELSGTWDISALVVFGGTGPEWGGAAVLKMVDKPWCWDAATGPAAEEDNTLTFTFEGINSEGNTYGTLVNDAGSDGKYADFIFINADPHIDVNGFYRKIPTGESTWVHNQTDGTVTFTFGDGTSVTGKLVEAGTETVYNDGSTVITKTVSNYSISFELSGTDDWTNIYQDLDKFVSRPRKYWIDISKSR